MEVSPTATLAPNTSRWPTAVVRALFPATVVLVSYEINRVSRQNVVAVPSVVVRLELVPEPPIEATVSLKTVADAEPCTVVS